MFTKKQIIAMIILILVTILIGFGLYYFFKKTDVGSPDTSTPTGISTPGELPSAGQRAATGTLDDSSGDITLLPGSGVITSTANPYRPEAVTKITTDFATFSSASNNGTYRYHNVFDGKFYKLDKDGNKVLLADKTFYNVDAVTWAPTKDVAVIEYPDDSKIIYNFETNTQVTIPKHWEEFSFSANSTEIAAKSLGLSYDNRYLITTGIDGTGTKIVEGMGDNEQYVDITWSPSRQVVALSQTGEPQGGDRREVLLIGLNGENFKSLIVEGSNFDSRWSTTGKKLLYNVDNANSDYKPALWITDAYGNSIGDNRQLLGLNTWADKCAFSDDTTLYCAVPTSLPMGAGINRNIADSIEDEMYKIDLKTGLKTPIDLGDDSYTIENISFNKEKNKLFFSDLNKTGLYEVNL